MWNRGRSRRGIERAAFASLALSRWVETATTVLISRPTSSGKSWLACALAQHACRRGHSALYLRVSRLTEELRILHGNGGFAAWLASLARTEVLILDDWALAPLETGARADLLEMIDDRAGTRPTILATQLPVEHWHSWIGDPTIADAILDRLLAREHRIALKGESLRPQRTRPSRKGGSDPTPEPKTYTANDATRLDASRRSRSPKCAGITGRAHAGRGARHVTRRRPQAPGRLRIARGTSNRCATVRTDSSPLALALRCRLSSASPATVSR
jgi:hypothetical protein